MSLNKMLCPKNIAVIGASANPKKIGWQIISNLKKSGFSGRIFPVNLNEKEIQGLKAYEKVNLIKEKVDLAVIAIPAIFVLPELKNCAVAGIKNVIIISSGFAESGTMGKKLQAEITILAQDQKMNILGPNCLGLINSAHHLNASFASANLGEHNKANVAVLSQSGAIGSIILDWANEAGVNLGYFISLGNKAVLSENDFLDYWRKDKKTEVVAIYLEELKNGQKFLEAVSLISREKPVVILKAGQAKTAGAAVFSHTGSLAGNSDSIKMALESSGAVVASNLEEFFAFIKLFSRSINLRNKNHDLFIVSNAGGPAILALDALEKVGVDIGSLNSSLKKSLRSVLSDLVTVHNPLDIIGDANHDRYEAALAPVLAAANVDNLMVILTPQTGTEVLETAEIIIKLAKAYPTKLVLPVFLGGDKIKKSLESFRQAGIPFFSSLNEAVWAYGLLNTYRQKRSQIKKYQKIKTRSGSNNRNLDYFSIVKLMKSYSIPLLAGQRIERTTDLNKLKFPAVLKVLGSKIIHKSDLGAVKTNLKNIDEAKKAWTSFSKLLKDKNNYCVGQKMEKGLEIIMGFKNNPELGLIMMIGTGGIYTEVWQDKSLALGKVDYNQALTMIKSLKIYPLLAGYRQQPKLYLTGLAKMLVKLSVLAWEHPEIKEFDINPIFVQTKAVKAVDFRALV
jgi:acetyltransferase